jgi:Zn-dependent M28 family amino/carboxypeptidase
MNVAVVSRFMLVALLFVANQATAQQNSALRAAADAIAASDLMRDATWLSSDVLRGRATPSPGLDSAAAYISRELRRLGFTPGGDNGTYLRHYTLRRETLDGANTRARIGNTVLTLGRDFTVTSFHRAGTFDAPVVYIGTGLHAPRLGLDAYANVDVRGKWVLVHAGNALPANVSRQQLGLLYEGHTTFTQEARTRGAIGVLLIPTAQALNAWATTPARVPAVRDIDPTAGLAYAPFPLPQITLSRMALEALLADQKVSATELLAAEASHMYPASFELRARFRADIASTGDTVRPFNVVAVLEGSDPAARREVISVASHLDGAVGGRVDGADSIFNAADDNASGSAGNLAIARALMKAPRPRRTIMLIWDTGEETGLWGSRALAYSPLADSIVAHFNMDMIGRSNPLGNDAVGENAFSGPDEIHVTGPRVLSTHMDSIVARVDRDYRFIQFDRQMDFMGGNFFYPRSDAAPYGEVGIPFIEFVTGIHGDYHRPTDEVSRLDPRKMEAVSRAAFVTLWLLANDPVTPRMDKPLPATLPFRKRM